MNKYQFIANAVAFIHGAIIIYLIFFIIYSIQKRAPKWYRVSVISMIIIQWISIFIFHSCPLTVLEKYFWNLAGQEGYPHGFVTNYLKKITGIDIPEGIVSLFIGIIATTIVFILIKNLFPKKLSV